MAIRFTRRRVLATLAILAVAGALGGAVAHRLAKQGAESAAKVPPTLEFAATDLTAVEMRPLSLWLAVSGALQPVRQAVVKARVSGEVRKVEVREGEPVREGQAVARFDTADLDVFRFIRRRNIGAILRPKSIRNGVREKSRRA